MRLRWSWGMGMAAVYSVFALGTCGMVALSLHEPVNLVSIDYYDQAVGLDARREAEARAAALGNAFAIAPDAADAERVVVAWPLDMPVESGTVTMYRPADSTKDRATAISRGGDGRQTVSLAGLTPGRWIVQVSWRSRGQSYYAERDLIVGGAR